MRTCSTANLTEKIKFQREEIEKLRREVYGTDKNLASKYIAAFTKEYVDYERVSSFEELYDEALKADIIYLGDYHALDKCQDFHSEFLAKLAGQTPNLMLAVEMLYGRNQRALDALMSGTISEKDFLRRVRYAIEWGYRWETYKKVLDTASQSGIKVWAVDCESRNSLSILKRDVYAAKKIVSILKANPGKKLVVIFGESHLASSHLPYQVKKLLQKENMRQRELFILQNIDEIYWNLACRGFEDESVVKVKSNKFCVFTATPFAKYESYRQVLEGWKALESDDDEIYINLTIYNLIDAILNFIRVNKYEHCLRDEGRCIEFMVDAYPEIYSAEDWETFESFLRVSDLSQPELQSILYHTRNNGSCYVPSVNAIYIGKFDLVHGAEEAAHFVNFACKREQLVEDGSGSRKKYHRVNTFYTKVIEEALGYFGSKLFDPSRDQIKESIFLNPHLLPEGGIRKLTALSITDYEFIRKFIHIHKRFEKEYRTVDKIPAEILRGIRARGRKYMLAAHELGYILGEQLYSGYIDGEVSREEIAQLFFLKFDQTGSALEKYLELTERLDFHLPLTRGRATRL